MSDSSPDGSRDGSFECFNGASAVDTGALPNLRVMENNDQIRELQTVIRDKYELTSYSVISEHIHFIYSNL